MTTVIFEALIIFGLFFVYVVPSFGIVSDFNFLLFGMVLATIGTGGIVADALLGIYYWKLKLWLNRGTLESADMGTSTEVFTVRKGAAPLKTILEYSRDILEKKYRLYIWCETKVNTLVTLDGLLLGGVFLAIGSIGVSGMLSVVSVTTAFMFILASLIVSLWHIKPLMFSGRTSRKNLRTVIGTEAYKSNEEYANELINLNIREMIQLDAEQIRGMNKNIMKDQKAITWGVCLTIASIPPLVIFLMSALKL